MSLKQKVRDWLDIKDPTEPVDHSKTIREFEATLKRFCEVQCSECKKLIVTYPMDGGYYRESDGTIICSSACLDRRKNGK